MNNKIVEDVVKIQDKKTLSDEGENLRDALRKYVESAEVNDGYSRADFLMMVSYMLGWGGEEFASAISAINEQVIEMCSSYSAEDLRDTVENLTKRQKPKIIH